MKSSDDKFERLRQQAKKRLTAQGISLEGGEEQKYLALLEELQVHQIELEIQNDELHAIQQELKTTRDEYTDLFDYAPVGYVTLAEDGVIKRANLTLASMLGVDRTTLQHHPLAHYVAPSSQDEYFLFLRSLTRDEPKETALRFRGPGGESFIGQMAVVPRSSNPRLFLTSITDVTERVRAQEVLRQHNTRLEEEVTARTAQLQQALKRAEEANQLKLKFLAMVSHELRTPLTTIIGFTDTLLATDITWTPEEQRDFLQHIREESTLLEDLVEQLLDMTRLEAGMMTVRPHPCEVKEIIQAADTALTHLTKEHTLLVQVPESLPPMLCDLRRTVQVLTNLVDNAAKYSPEETEIIITARTAHDYVEVSVIDQGPGIPKEERMHIFDAFQRAGAAERLAIGGFGLGLAICSGLIEAQNGSIGISDEYTDGAHFWFRLPIAASK